MCGERRLGNSSMVRSCWATAVRVAAACSCSRRVGWFVLGCMCVWLKHLSVCCTRPSGAAGQAPGWFGSRVRAGTHVLLASSRVLAGGACWHAAAAACGNMALGCVCVRVCSCAALYYGFHALLVSARRVCFLLCACVCHLALRAVCACIRCCHTGRGCWRLQQQLHITHPTSCVDCFKGIRLHRVTCVGVTSVGCS